MTTLRLLPAYPLKGKMGWLHLGTYLDFIILCTNIEFRVVILDVAKLISLHSFRNQAQVKAWKVVTDMRTWQADVPKVRRYHTFISVLPIAKLPVHKSNL